MRFCKANRWFQLLTWDWISPECICSLALPLTPALLLSAIGLGLEVLHSRSGVGKKRREQNVLLSLHAFMNWWGGKQIIISARTQWGTAGGWVRAIKVMCFLRKCYWHILTTDASPLCVMLADWLPSSQSQLFDWIMIGDLGHWILALPFSFLFELYF